MSVGFSPLTMAAALHFSSFYIGRSQRHITSTEPQAAFFGLLPSYIRSLSRYKGITHGYSATTAQYVNGHLHDYGFSITLKPWSERSDGFGVAGIVDATVSWRQANQKVRIRSFGEYYPGFRMPTGGECSIVQAEGITPPVIHMHLQGGLEARIIMGPEPSSQLELTNAALGLFHARTGVTKKYDSTYLPMMRLVRLPNISWMIGWTVRGKYGVWHVEQAVQQVYFAMNEHGIRIREATALAASEFKIQPSINVGPAGRSALITIGRPHMPVPIFQASIAREDWRDPGGLTSI